MNSKLKTLLLLLVISFSAPLSAYELVVATMFRNEAPYFKEWIEYHKMVGVEHFWLYNDRSTDNWEEVLAPYIAEGLVEIIDWPTPLAADGRSNHHYFATQCAAFRDSLRKGRGTTSWLAFIDIDEFLLPTKEATVLECLNVHFQDTHAVYTNWRCFGSGEKYIPLGAPLLFELTASSLKNHPRNCVGKTIIRPESAEISLLWHPHTCPLRDGCIYRDGDGGIIPEDNHPDKVAAYLRQNGDLRPINLHEEPELQQDGSYLQAITLNDIPSEDRQVLFIDPQNIEYKTVSLKLDELAHTKFLRINHYVMRDRGYFENVRLARARNGYNGYSMNDEKLLLEQNEQFSLLKDYSIINFIKKRHPEIAKTFWNQK